MQAVISRAIPHVTVQDVQVVPSLRLQRLYGVKVSDGTSLVLSLPPPLMVRLLRSERTSISSEAAVLRWLSDVTSSKRSLEQVAQGQHQDADPEPQAEEAREQARQGKTAVQPTRDFEVVDEHLAAILPTLLAHASSSNEFGIEYNVTKPTPGVPIAELEPGLTAAERSIVDLQTGKLYRRLSQLLSPNGRFGPAFAVLPTLPPPSSGSTQSTRDANARLRESRGVETWSTAFQSLLEGVLRDGEDMAVMLSYATVRRHFRRFEHLLNAVTKPRLVAIDAGDDANVLVHRQEQRASTQLKRPLQGPSQKKPDAQGGHDDEDESSETDSEADESESEADEGESEADEGEAVIFHEDSEITVTGLKDWSNFIFGDPLFATAFGKDPTAEFLKGFSGPVDSESEAPTIFSSSLVEDRENAHIRLLLYQCYHTVMLVIREFFRPQKDSSRRELAARKKLNDILAKLDALDDEGHYRRRRPSGEMSPAKRPKSDGEGD